MLNKTDILYLCMLTYLDGMKWNCLAQRYLYTAAIRDSSHLQNQLSILKSWISQNDMQPVENSSSRFCLSLLQTVSFSLWQLCLLSVLYFGLTEQSGSAFAATKCCLDYVPFIFVAINAKLPIYLIIFFPFYVFLPNIGGTVMKANGCGLSKVHIIKATHNHVCLPPYPF